MKPLILFFKKQIAVEEKIQRMLRYLQDMNHLYREAYQTYLEGNHEKFFSKTMNLEKLNMIWTTSDFKFRWPCSMNH